MNFDVVVIGGGPSGIQAAISTRLSYPRKTLALVRRDAIGLQISAVPHALGRLKSVDDSIFPDILLTQRDIEIIIGEVEQCDGHSLRLREGSQIDFHKLILAVGGCPAPLGIPGTDQSGVFEISRDFGHLKTIREALGTARSILLIGGGRTGVEVAEELLKTGKTVALVESRSHLLPDLVDPEFGHIIKEELTRAGANVITGCAVRALLGKQSVLGADLVDGRWLTADVVLLAPPFRPSLQLAEAIGLNVDPNCGIIVDEYLRTSFPNICAVGECAAGRSFFAAEQQRTTLLSEAMAQARLAGSNLFAINVAKAYTGSLGSFSAKTGSLVLGVTGLTEIKARAIGLEYVVGLAETIDRHPSKLKGANRVVVKLLFDRSSRHLVGAQVLGGESTGECVNMLAVMVQKKMTDMEIDTLQLGTHPLLMPSPWSYGVMGATVDAARNWSSSEHPTSSRSTTASKTSSVKHDKIDGAQQTPRQG